MDKLTVLMCSWRSPAMLNKCLESLKASFTVSASIKVVLNEADEESVNVCLKHNVEFVKLNSNLGTLAVDCASSLINSEYVVNTNDDMLFFKGWDSDLISIIEENYPCSASCSLVEPFYSSNPVVYVDDLGRDLDAAYESFIKNCQDNKYSLDRKISYTHPIMVRFSDFAAVNGYSNGLDMRYHPGYGLDDNFPWRLWKLYNEQFKFIASGKSFVYHLGSATNNKLAPDIKQRSGWNEFIQDAGFNIHEFRAKIKCFSLI